MKKNLLFLLMLLFASMTMCASVTRNDGILYSQDDTSETPVSTVAEVIAGTDGTTFRVKGVCTSVLNTTYGNWYLKDATGELYIYGTVDATGAYNWSSFNIEAGDEVTVEGPRASYGSVVELKDATFISVTKSPVRVESVSTDLIPAAGGDVEVNLSNKGEDISVEIPAEAQTWLSVKSSTSTKVVLHAEANTSALRSAKVTFTTSIGSTACFAQATIAQEGLAGTIAIPFTVAEAIDYCNELGTGGKSTDNFCVKGKVSKIQYEFSEKYGTATFWISDDGEYRDGDQTHDFEAYSVYYFNNEKFADGNAQVSLGDEVAIYGILCNYKGTAETASKSAYVYSVNGVTTDENGLGSEAAPFNAVGAIACANSGFANNVYISGKVSKIVFSFTEKYGFGSFYISQDGTYYGDTTKDFEVYRTLWLDNKKWVEGDPEVAVGDAVTVYGTLTLYKGTAETVSGKAYVVSYKAKTDPEEQELRLDSVVRYKNGELDTKSVLTYDSRSMISEETYLTRSGEDWTNSMRYQYTRNEQGLPTLTKTSKWNTDAWRYDSKTENAYDGHGNNTINRNFKWTDDDWKFTSGYTYAYTYDEKDRKSTLSASTYNTSEEIWQVYQKEDYAYDENGNMIRNTIYYPYGDEDDTWGSTVYAYTYDDHNNETGCTVTDEGVVFSEEKYEYTYDAQGKILSRLYYYKNQGDEDFTLASKVLNTYNSEGNYLTYEYYKYTDGEWQLSNGMHYKYEFNADKTQKVISIYSWDGTTEQIAYVYYYSAGTADGIAQVTTLPAVHSTRKYLSNGRLVIRRTDGTEYNLNGVRTK